MATLLIVDDEDMLRRAYRRALKGLYEITEVSTEEAAVAAFEGGFRPDLVLTDFHIGAGDGREVVRVAQSLGIRVIMMTSDPEGAAGTPAPILDKMAGPDAMRALIAEVLAAPLWDPLGSI